MLQLTWDLNILYCTHNSRSAAVRCVSPLQPTRASKVVQATFNLLTCLCCIAAWVPWLCRQHFVLAYQIHQHLLLRDARPQQCYSKLQFVKVL